MNFEKDKKLSDHTTFGIGGNARYFAVVTSLAEAEEAIAFAGKEKLPIFVLGGGSNVLVSDQGFPGVVLKNEIKAFKQKENFVTVGAGENWDDVVEKCIGLKLQGIECLSGIPGTFGGAIVQNIGAYGQTLSDVVDSVEVLEMETGNVRGLGKDECGFEYRNSLFKQNPGKYLVVAAILKLFEIDRGNISFHSLAEKFQGQPVPSLAAVRNAVIDIRAAKGMVILDGYESYKSAGSFFKNPVVTEFAFEKFKDKISCPDPWYWNQSDGVKVSAACLVTQAGFSKGQIVDAAQISPKQPLAIINPGFARAGDIRNLAKKIKQAVQDKFGVELEEEIMYVGQF